MFILLNLLLFYFNFIICIENNFIKIPIFHNMNKNAKNIEMEKRDGNINLNNFKNISYYGEIKINNQIFKMLFDTGSNNIWIPSNICGVCLKHNIYKINNIKEINYNWWYITYGGNSFVSGLLINGNIDFNGLLLKNQTLGIAGFISNDLNNVSFDGIMGLGISNNNYNSIIKNLYDQKIINKKLFSFYTNNTDGEIIFGDYDNSKYIGNLYNITIDKINTKVINKNINAIIDTGTTLIVFNETTAKDIANNINAKEQNKGVFVINCDEKQINKLTLTLNINNKEFNISKYDLIFNKYNNKCILGFSYSTNIDFIILGNIFIKKYYMIFNEEIPQISIANLK